jgi:hypothetical protein
MALLWKDSPENPNRGKDSKTRKPKEPASKPASKAAAKKDKPKSKKKAAETEEEAEEAEGEGEGEVPSSEQEVVAPSSDD